MRHFPSLRVGFEFPRIQRVKTYSYFFAFRFSKAQFQQEKEWKETGRSTKSDLKNVNMATAVFETEIRKEQHEREKAWKEKSRNTKKEYEDVNMAKAAFG